MLNFFIDSTASNQTTVEDKVLRDIAYCNTSNASQTLNAYLPEDGEVERPVVLYIHGGGWKEGDKVNAISDRYAPLFVDRNIAFISIDYRLTNEAAYPAQNEDVRCAIDYVRAQDTAWNLNTTNFIIMGDSAGGQLASLEALERKELYKGVISAYGVSNVWRQISSLHDTNALLYVGHAQQHMANLASPQSANLEGAPPFLLIHGTADAVVPANESENFSHKLEAVGDSVRYVPINHAPHAFLGTGNSYDLEAQLAIFEFVESK